jgi:glycosyltransferase involved in cell wall biosynthesis
LTTVTEMSSPRPKKILHIITTSGFGGAELMLCRLLERNDSSRHQQAVLSLLTPHSLKERIERSAPLYTLDMRPPLPSIGNFRRLRTIIRDYRPDLMQGWMYHGNLAATVGATLAGFKGPVLWNVRHSLHDLAHEKPVSRLIIRLNARLSHRPRAIIYNSTASIEQHQAIGFAADRAVFMPNGVDCTLNCPRPELRDVVRAELGIEKDAPLIGMIARHHRMKDPENLLKALAIIEKRLPAVRLIIAGERFDQTNQPVLSAIAAHGLEDRVQLLGQREDVPRLLAAIDVVALPSAWGEGFPNAIGEAAAAGVPSVATDIGDAARVVGDGGRIVPPSNSEALAAALIDILALDPAERQKLGETARQHVISHFELDAIARRFAGLHDLFLDPDNRKTPSPDLLRRLSPSGGAD